MNLNLLKETFVSFIRARGMDRHFRRLGMDMFRSAQFGQKLAIGYGVAVETGQQQHAQALLGGMRGLAGTACHLIRQGRTASGQQVRTFSHGTPPSHQRSSHGPHKAPAPVGSATPSTYQTPQNGGAISTQ